MSYSRQQLQIIRFMSGGWGRALRIGFGIALGVIAISGAGWWLLLLLPAVLVITTGVMNYCPAGLMMSRPGNRSEFMASLKPVNLLGNK